MSNTPEIVKTSFNTNNIKENIKNINILITTMESSGVKDPFEYELKILTDFPEFYDEYPFLVKKLCKKDDINILYKMLDNLDMVENGNKSLASVEHNLGSELANKYLYPVVNKK